MAALDLALSRIQDDAGTFLPPERINQLARESGQVFRNTKLTPGNTLRLFAQQIVAGNIACSMVHHLAVDTFFDTAWCQARERLPIELIEQVHLHQYAQVSTGCSFGHNIEEMLWIERASRVQKDE